MRFYAGFFTLIVIIESAFGYSTSSGAAAGAGSFASTGTAGQMGVSSSGGLPNTYTGNTVSSLGGNYGAQYPYADNTVGTSPYGVTGGVSGGVGGGAYSGSGSGAFSGAGGGSYAGTGAAPFVPPGQYPPHPSQYDYQNLFLNFWKSLSDNYANAATMTFASPGANAFAAASSGPSHNELINQQLAQQAALFNQINAAGSRFGGAAGGGHYAPNFASSSATYGPDGFHQTANIVPANPNSPNVDSRFGSETPIVTMSAGQPGFYGVSSSSFSTSSDINGQKSSHREAQTSVNDNGKVTTYTVRS